MTGKDIGEHTVPITLDLPAGVTLEEEVTIPVTVKEKARTDSETEAGTDAQNAG